MTQSRHLISAKLPRLTSPFHHFADIRLDLMEESASYQSGLSGFADNGWQWGFQDEFRDSL